MVLEELFTISKTYPVISIIIALILFLVGLKYAKKIMWILGVIALIIAFVLLFFPEIFG